MGLFSKKPRIEVCDMCGKSDVDGCGSAHNHVVEIKIDDPAWLPANYRSKTQGRYTFLCTRCNSHPEGCWESDGSAWAGMMVHLGGTHYVGEFKAATDRLTMIRVK